MICLRYSPYPKKENDAYRSANFPLLKRCFLIVTYCSATVVSWRFRLVEVLVYENKWWYPKWLYDMNVLRSLVDCFEITFSSSLFSSTKMKLPSVIIFFHILSLSACFPVGERRIALEKYESLKYTFRRNTSTHEASPTLQPNTAISNNNPSALELSGGDSNTTSHPSDKAKAANNGNENGQGAGTSTKLLRQASSVISAANAFSADVMTVSSSLNALSTCTDPAEIINLARKGYVAEKDEDDHRAVLNRAAGAQATVANAKIVGNTPIVLLRFQNMMVAPSSSVVQANLLVVQAAR